MKYLTKHDFLLGSPSPKKKKQFLSPRDEEERRKILKMLVTPRSGNGVPAGGSGEGNTLLPRPRHDSSVSFDNLIIKAARSAEDLPEKATIAEMYRKDSSLSLQIPGMISPSAILANKKVTFSQVVDHMACSLSDSSSMSDLSCSAEDFKLSVSSSGHLSSTRRARKLLRSARIQSKRKHNHPALSHQPNAFLSGNSTEEVYESSMESIESSSNLYIKPPLSALSPNARHLQKIASADSLLSMIKTLAAPQNTKPHSSMPSSPQLSDEKGLEPASGFPSPLNTPDTLSSFSIGSPRRDSRKDSLLSQESSLTVCGTQVMVEVHADQPDSDSDSTLGQGQAQGSGSSPGVGNPGGMTLEVPGFHYGKCLSPIKELPSPIPTPVASPLPVRSSPQGSNDDLSTCSSRSSSSTTSSRRSSFRNRSRRKGVSSPNPPASPNGSAGSPRTPNSADGTTSPHRSESIPVPVMRRRFSYAGDDTTLYQETSFVVPVRTKPLRKQHTIPTIMLSVHDSSDSTAKEPEPKREESPPQPVPSIEISSPKSPGYNDREFAKESQLPSNILIPQVFITCDDDDTEQGMKEDPVAPARNGSASPIRDQRQCANRSQSPAPSIASNSSNSTSTPAASPVAQKPKRAKWKPPPINIPNSNFGTFIKKAVGGVSGSGGNSSSSSISGNSSSSGNEVSGGKDNQRSKNGQDKDTVSKPDVSEEIELKELSASNSRHSTHSAAPQPMHNPPSRESMPNSCSPNVCSIPVPIITCSSPSPLVEIAPLLPEARAANQPTTPVETPPNSGKSTKVESPKFLTLGVFDSAPRSRSQSVEIPEFQATALKHHQQQQQANMFPKRYTRPPSPRPEHCLKRRDSIDESPGPPVTNPCIPVVTPLSARRSSRDERLALLLRQRSLVGADACMGNNSQAMTEEGSSSSWKGIKLGSPPTRRELPTFPPPTMSGGKIGTPMGAFPSRGSNYAGMLRCYDKPQSLDLPAMAPTITVTPMFEVTSDHTSTMSSDGDSPVIKVAAPSGASHLLQPPASSNMHFLSPFSIHTNNPHNVHHPCGGSRTTSESNLSSSGYSSMASPGPSRSGSSNPLCYESEDTSSTPTSSSGFFSCGGQGGCVIHPAHMGPLFVRRPSPLLKSPSVDSESSDPLGPPPTIPIIRRQHQGLRKLHHEKALQYR